MEKERPLDLESYFAAVEDPRVERTKQHKLLDIIIMAICGVICGAEGWVEIEEFGKAKQAWLAQLLELPNGIPSHDTFGRVFARLDPVQFEELCWLLEASAEKMEGLISSVTSSLKNTSHARKASSSENLSHWSMKRSYLVKGRANTSCLVHSSENNGKTGPKVCDFPGEARSPQRNLPLLRTHVRAQALRRYSWCNPPRTGKEWILPPS